MGSWERSLLLPPCIRVLSGWLVNDTGSSVMSKRNIQGEGDCNSVLVLLLLRAMTQPDITLCIF